jgi:hypothetical protein
VLREGRCWRDGVVCGQEEGRKVNEWSVDMWVNEGRVLVKWSILVCGKEWIGSSGGQLQVYRRLYRVVWVGGGGFDLLNRLRLHSVTQG